MMMKEAVRPSELIPIDESKESFMNENDVNVHVECVHVHVNQTFVEKRRRRSLLCLLYSSHHHQREEEEEEEKEKERNNEKKSIIEHKAD